MNEIIEADYIRNLNNLEIQSNFLKEGQVISTLIKKYSIRYYIDFGCWYGFLLKNVLTENRNVEFIALDAVKNFLEIAKENMSDFSGTFYNIAIKAGCMPKEVTFQLNLKDTSKSGFNAIGSPIDPMTILSMKEFLKLYPLSEKFTNGYLKIDMEGVDIDVLEQLFELRIFPKVIHFEVLQRTMSRFFEFTSVLRSNNYRVHEIKNEGHKFYAMICSVQESIEIGFYPYLEYYNA